MYLLDTNVLSELRTGKPQPDVQVLAWAAGVPLAVQYLTSSLAMNGGDSLYRTAMPDRISLR